MLVLRTAAVVVLCCALVGCSKRKAKPSPDEKLEQTLAIKTGASLFVELDYFQGPAGSTEPLQKPLDIAKATFKLAGIDLVFVVAPGPSADASKIHSRSELSDLLKASRTPALKDHVHLLVAGTSDGQHGETVFGASSRASPDRAGGVVYIRTILQDWTDNPKLGEAGISLDHLVGRTIAHEIGHLIGCAHPSGDGDASVMTQNGKLGAVTDETIERWKQATLGPSGDGVPQFSPEAIIEFSLEDKLSVERGVPSYPDE